MTAQPTRPTGEPGPLAPTGAARSCALAPSATAGASRTTGTRRAAASVRGRAVLAALGLALAAAVLPVTAAHASPQPPDLDNQLANPTEDPEPPLPPEPPDNGPADEANPVDTPDPPQPPTPDRTPPADDAIPTPQRVDAGFGGAAVGSHHAAGLALIGAALILTLLVLVIARRQRSEAGSPR